jgi:hypothetical protein
VRASGVQHRLHSEWLFGAGTSGQFPFHALRRVHSNSRGYGFYPQASPLRKVSAVTSVSVVGVCEGTRYIFRPTTRVFTGGLRAATSTERTGKLRRDWNGVSLTVQRSGPIDHARHVKVVALARAHVRLVTNGLHE